MAGFNEEQMRQLQALLQPQSASLEALSSTVSQMNEVTTREIETVNNRIGAMQAEFNRRPKLLEERAKSTSPPRKAAKGSDKDEDMEPTPEMEQAPRLASAAAQARPAHNVQRTSFTRSASAPAASRARGGNSDDDKVVISKLPELATSRAAKAWWASLLAHLPADLPRPTGVRILDFHDHITATFADTDDAVVFHDGISDRGVKFTKRNGDEAQVESFRPRPPHIKRRGAALHPVYGVLQSTALLPNESIKQVHRARSTQPYTLSYAMHKMTEDIRLLATVAWNDSGERVSLQEVAPEPGLSEDTQRKLKALLSPPAP